MQKDFPKPELSLPEAELEIPAKSTTEIKPATKSKLNLQLLVFIITVLFLLGVVLSIIFFLLKSGSIHF